jgi:hypothetical protein
MIHATIYGDEFSIFFENVYELFALASQSGLPTGKPPGFSRMAWALSHFNSAHLAW